MEFLDFIIKQSVPIIENRIKDIIRGVAKEYYVDPIQVLAILKMTDNINKRMEIFTFGNKKTLNRMELNQIKGGITSQVEKYIAGVFNFDAKRYQVSTAYVNYKFWLMPNGQLLGCRNIAGIDYPQLNLKDLLFQKD